MENAEVRTQGTKCNLHGTQKAPLEKLSGFPGFKTEDL